MCVAFWKGSASSSVLVLRQASAKGFFCEGVLSWLCVFSGGECSVDERSLMDVSFSGHSSPERSSPEDSSPEDS